MTRTFTGLCIASAFAFAATAAAQSGTSTTTAGQSAQATGHEVSVTGCLAKSGDGTYMLTNARVEPAGSASSASTTTGSATTTAGAATGTTGSSEPSSSAHSGAMANDSTWTLRGGSDLDKHVGHKVQVTGNATWSSSEHSSNGFTSTGAATASTGSTTAGAAGTTTGSTGTTGSATGEQRSSASSTAGAGNSHPRLDVQSVKMVASSCS